ncbi:MAG: ABC transporter ATP-binding protein/permease [Clostridia bacterium]|nr:ABC transporter ATP-binding protein/permease [Clostridia bacterium]
MLELKDIKKIYPAGQDYVQALKGISLKFRESEFVSILGPSGCGKTTMLNIIGGLDRYTEGDLIIDGKSTKTFGSRDWDTYRNHSIGFVFQSYNLIPHQSVLQNVELALTLSGVSKKERRTRAKRALEQVGLGDQLKKKPGEMSGGQMQRVAIARALVNNPDIILADEPTGALDTETSVQVMELLKEVAKDRLVIMVTHNPELADQYSTRIIRMLDGELIGDSNPIHEPIEAPVPTSEKKVNKVKKPSMSIWTAFGLSMKNLFTKKGRTMLTSFAGSIGIIGIALIFAVSNGMKTYIDDVQEETLSSYPITLQSQHVDIASMMQAFSGAAQSKHEHDLDKVYQKSIIQDLVNALSSTEIQENDLASFKVYLEEAMKDNKKAQEAISGIQYTYDLDLSVYTQNVEGELVRSDTQELLTKMMMQYMGATMGAAGGQQNNSGSAESTGGMASMGPMGSMMGGSSGMWQEMLQGTDGALINDMVHKQYDLIYGSWPNSYNEVVLVVDENNELDDLTLYALGLKTQADIDAILEAAINKTELKEELQSWSYQDICAREYKVVLESDCYYYSETTGTCMDLRERPEMFENVFKNKAIPLRVTGIIRPNPDSTSHMITGSIAYTKLLTEHVIEQATDSASVQAQMQRPGVDIFTGLPFKDTEGLMSEQKKAEAFMTYVSGLSNAEKGALYVQIQSVPDAEWLSQAVQGATAGKTVEEMRTMLLAALSQAYEQDQDSLKEYIEAQDDDAIRTMFEKVMAEACKAQYAEGVAASMKKFTDEQLAGMLTKLLAEAEDSVKSVYYDSFLEFSASTYADNLIRLGCPDLDTPSGINLFASSFENKDRIEELISEYNEGKDEVAQIAYTDYVGLLMSFITVIIDAITYVLIAFVSISLVVSSIMIGVITLISVQERTKEIGILRAIGASKRDVSSMFNAETVMIGFASGVLGVGITYLLCFPINAIIQGLTGIYTLRAFLPLKYALWLVVISVVLTLIAGIIPSRSAAKKDPVVALRTE